jgi:hypothetical protein
LGIEWIDQSGPHLFGGLEKGTNTQVFWGLWQPVSLSPVSIQSEGPSAVFRNMRVLGADGEMLAEYRLFEHETRVDVNVLLRRSELPFVPYSQESLHLAISFPANLSLPTTLWIDGPGGWFIPGPDSLPGTSLGHFGCANGARLVGGDGRWLSISSADSPIVDLGEMDESPLATIETDETALTWRLIRHASLGEVRSGELLPFDAEPGMPDVIPFTFRIRFGDASTSPPEDGAYRRDLAPPQAIWISPARR